MMYAAYINDLYSGFEITQSIAVFDPESSETVEESSEIADSVEDELPEDEDSDAVYYMGDDENDTSEDAGRTESISDISDETDSISVQSSGSDLSLDNSDDTEHVLSGGRNDSESEEEESTSDGSHAGSDQDTESGEEETDETGSDVQESGSGNYRITIEGDAEEVGELIRILNGESEEEEEENVRDSNSDDGSDSNSGNNGGSEISELSPVLRSVGSDSNGDSSGTVHESGIDPESIEFYNRNLESLGIIAGCLFFIVFVIVCRYIYRFFRLFI